MATTPQVDIQKLVMIHLFMRSALALMRCNYSQRRLAVCSRTQALIMTVSLIWHMGEDYVGIWKYEGVFVGLDSIATTKGLALNEQSLSCSVRVHETAGNPMMKTLDSSSLTNSKHDN